MEYKLKPDKYLVKYIDIKTGRKYETILEYYSTGCGKYSLWWNFYCYLRINHFKNEYTYNNICKYRIMSRNRINFNKTK